MEPMGTADDHIVSQPLRITLTLLRSRQGSLGAEGKKERRGREKGEGIVY